MRSRQRDFSLSLRPTTRSFNVAAFRRPIITTKGWSNNYTPNHLRLMRNMLDVMIASRLELRSEYSRPADTLAIVRNASPWLRTREDERVAV